MCVNPMFFIFLSFFIIFLHFFDFFIFFHFFIFFIVHFLHFFHVLSCSFMFFHVLSFIFFHFLSFSFVFFLFVRCSTSDFFLGLNFVTISLDNSDRANDRASTLAAEENPTSADERKNRKNRSRERMTCTPFGLSRGCRRPVHAQ